MHFVLAATAAHIPHGPSHTQTFAEGVIDDTHHGELDTNLQPPIIDSDYIAARQANSARSEAAC